MSTPENSKPVEYVIVATLRRVIGITDVYDAISNNDHTKYNTAEDALMAMSKGFYDDSDYAVFDTNCNKFTGVSNE